MYNWSVLYLNKFLGKLLITFFIFVGFVKVPSIAFWTQLFANYFLHVDNPQHDDLLFYVKKPEDADSPVNNGFQIF